MKLYLSGTVDGQDDAIIVESARVAQAYLDKGYVYCSKEDYLNIKRAFDPDITIPIVLPNSIRRRIQSDGKEGDNDSMGKRKSK